MAKFFKSFLAELGGLKITDDEAEFDLTNALFSTGRLALDYLLCKNIFTKRKDVLDRVTTSVKNSLDNGKRVVGSVASKVKKFSDSSRNNDTTVAMVEDVSDNEEQGQSSESANVSVTEPSITFKSSAFDLIKPNVSV